MSSDIYLSDSSRFTLDSPRFQSSLSTTTDTPPQQRALYSYSTSESNSSMTSTSTNTKDNGTSSTSSSTASVNSTNKEKNDTNNNNNKPTGGARSPRHAGSMKFPGLKPPTSVTNINPYEHQLLDKLLPRHVTHEHVVFSHR